MLTKGNTPKLGLLHSTAVVLASMIGSGIFMTTGQIGPMLVSPLNVYLAWIVGAIFAFCGALCFAELGARFPKSGGTYIYAKQAFGARIGAFVGLEAILVAFPATLAIIALVFGEYLVSVWTLLPPEALAVVALSLACLVHSRGLVFGARINSAAALLKILLVVLFAALAIFGNGEPASNSDYLMQHQVPSIWSKEFATAVTMVSFAYVGWNNLTMLSGEINRPSQNIPRSLVFGVLLVVFLYLGINFSYLSVVAPTAMVDGAGNPTPTIAYLVAEKSFPRFLSEGLGGGIAFIVFSTLLSVSLAGGRMAFAMSRAKQLPNSFGLVNRGGAPQNSLLLQALISIALCLTLSIPELLIFTGISGFISLLIVFASVFKLRIGAEFDSMPFRIPAFPIPVLLVMAMSVWLLIQTAAANIEVLAVNFSVLGILILICVFYKETP